MVKRFQACLSSVLVGLRSNRTLKEWKGTWTTAVTFDFVDVEFWSFLASLLQNHNTSLAFISMPSGHECAKIAKELGKIRYWTTLNGSGRAQLRDPSVHHRDIVDVLSAVQDPSLDGGSSAETLGILFGLLLESASSWSATAC